MIKRRFKNRTPGRSLLELLVALVIGFIILAAVLLTSLGNGGSSRRQDSLTTLNEDAQIAANLLSSQLRIAGYSAFTGAPQPGLGIPYRNYIGPPVRGCDGGMQNIALDDMELINCVGGAGPDAFMVAYEANTTNTFPTAANPGVPTDCLGASLPPPRASDDPNAPPYYRANNIFYIDRNTNSLMCSGNGNLGQPQPLIGNVIDMQVSYGVAAMSLTLGQDKAPLFEATQYLTATELDQLPILPIAIPPNPQTQPVQGRWVRVVSMRVCLVMQSTTELYDQVTPYTGCNGQQVVPADRRAYRAVNITTAFKNKTAACSDTTAAPGQGKESPDRCAI
jgi:type II secretory pathway pseudopilin PulG